MSGPTTSHEAEAAIATVLQQLEQNSGMLVEAIRLTRYDGTTISSTRRNVVMQVSVDLQRPSAHGWSQAIPKTAPGQPYRPSDHAAAPDDGDEE